MQFLPNSIDRYSTAFTDKEHPVLHELYRETHLTQTMPQMVSGHMQGSILQLFVHMAQPKRILEVGTFTGYSAIAMALAMQDGGKLHTIEYDDKYKEIIEQYVQKAGVQDRITLHFGSGLEVIPQLKGAFDMVFIDADKINYSAYYDLIFDQVPIGGYLIADNVMWSGKVTEDESQFDKDTSALHAYNKKIALDPRVKHILLPLRDGLMVAQKVAQ